MSNKPGGKHYRAIEVEFEGVKYETLKKLFDAHDCAVSYSTFILRYDMDWPIDRALFEESRDKRLKIIRN